MNEVEGRKAFYNGSIPNDWDIMKFEKVTEVITCGLAATPIYVDEKLGMPFFSAQNVQNGKVVYDNFKYISFDLYNQITKNNKPQKGDLLYTRVGAGIGEAAVIDRDFDFGIYVSLTLIKPKIVLLNNLFLMYLLNSKTFKYLAKRDQFAGGGVQNLNVQVVKGFLIPLPPLSEQRAIAKILGLMDEAINWNNEYIAKKELSKKWLMQNLLTGKKRLKGFEGDLKERQLGELFSERNETKYFDLPLLSVGANGIYPQNDSIKKDTSNDDKSKYKRICPNDIGYNTMRMWQGRSALSGLEGIISPAYTVVKPKENANSLYFSYLFKTPKMMNLFWRNSQGLVDDTLNCKYKDFSIIKVIVPYYEEQKAIATVLQAADKEIELLKAKGEKLREEKKGLMQVLLTGRKRVKYNI